MRFRHAGCAWKGHIGMKQTDMPLTDKLADPIAELAPHVGPKLAVILVFSILSLGPITVGLYLPALPLITEAFDTAEASAKFTVTSYVAGFCMTQLICGPLSDAFGRRLVIISFLGMYIASTILCTVSTSIQFLVFARFVQGASGGFGWSLSRAVLLDLYTGARSARIMSLVGVLIGVGASVGPLIGAIASEIFGWRGVFLAMAGFGCLGLLVTLTLLPETNTQRDKTAVRPLPLIRNYIEVGRNVRFISPTVCLGLSYGVAYSIVTLLPFILISRLDLHPAQFGFVMMLHTGGFISGSFVGHRLNARLSPSRVMRLGLWMQIGGAGVMIGCLATIGPQVATIIGPVAIISAGNAMVMPNATALALSPFSNRIGAASALMSFIQIVCGFFSSLMITVIADPFVAVTLIPLLIPLGGIVLTNLVRERGAAAGVADVSDG